ncbi:hypothetical protein Vi05172_g3837 [Venturia inaequalis]|nr:hypothetical protein Vi05172_g3837 [Venturia inaequalis]
MLLKISALLVLSTLFVAAASTTIPFNDCVTSEKDCKRACGRTCRKDPNVYYRWCCDRF